MKIKINWAKNNGKSWRPAFHYSKEKPIATLMNFELNGKEYTENIYSISTLAGRIFVGSTARTDGQKKPLATSDKSQVCKQAGLIGRN